MHPLQRATGSADAADPSAARGVAPARAAAAPARSPLLWGRGEQVEVVPASEPPPSGFKENDHPPIKRPPGTNRERVLSMWRFWIYSRWNHARSREKALAVESRMPPRPLQGEGRLSDRINGLEKDKLGKSQDHNILGREGA